MTMRVAVVMPMHWSFSLGGAEMQVRMLVERLAMDPEAEVHFIAREVHPDYRPSGYTLHKLRGRRSIAGTFATDIPDLLSMLRALQPEVVYQRIGCAYTAAVALHGKTHSCRTLWHVSSDSDIDPQPMSFGIRLPFLKLDRWLIDYGARRVQSVVTQTATQSRRLAERFGRSDAIQLPNFHPSPGALTPKPALATTVCWVGNLKPLKRPEVFIELSEQLSSLPDVEFVIVGARQMDGPVWDALAGAMASQPNLRYLGHLRQEEVNELLSRAHILVNTSVYEGMPNTFIQAWSRQVPVVSLCVDPDRLLADEGLGFCADGSVPALVEHVRGLVTDPALRSAIGERAAQFARAHFSSANLDRLVQLIKGTSDPDTTTPTHHPALPAAKADRSGIQ